MPSKNTLADMLERELSNNRDTIDLARSMRRIREFLDEWWMTNHLPWFTDHGPKHSARVSELAMVLGTPPSINPAYALTLLERYSLWAASMLHDIGMQIIDVDGATLGSLSPEDFRRVRHEHAMKSGDYLIGQFEECGLVNDPALATIISNVARAHGTAYYRTTIASSPANMPARGEDIRVHLLSALLLMADELDLEYVRVVPPSGRVVIPSVSKAHVFKHECIDSCRVSSSASGDVQIALSFTFPDQLPPETCDLVEFWVTEKIREQIGMTESELLSGFYSQVRFSRNITSSRAKATNRRSVDQAALKVIRAEVAELKMINHREVLKDVVGALGAAASGSVVIITGEVEETSGHDLDGREDLLSAVIVRMDAEGWNVVRSDRARLNRAIPLSDIVCEWLECQATPYDPTNQIEDLLTSVTDSCSEDEKYIFTASCLEALEPKDSRLLLDKVVPFILDRVPSARFLFSAKGITAFGDAKLVVMPVGRLADVDLVAFMGRVLPMSVAVAAPLLNDTYLQYKRDYQRGALSLERSPR